MKPRECSSVIHVALRISVLAGLLVLVSRTDLRAEQEPAPYAYLFPQTLRKLIEHLQREGVEMSELREDIDLDVEVYRIRIRGKRPTQGHRETRRFEAGTILVKSKQESGDKVRELFDPVSGQRAEDRKLFGRLRKGKDYPVVVLCKYVPIRLGAARPLKEEREFGKPITFETVYDPKKKVNFGGSVVSGLRWLPDGEHYLQVRDGKLYKVHAVSGRSGLFFEPDKLARALKGLPTIDEKTAKSLSKRTSLRMDPDRTAILIDYENDLYYCTLDGKTAVRLTSSPAPEGHGTFAPNGEFVAFVREKNLYVVDVATQTERALTTSGGGVISNGKADWVYFEEVYGRKWQAFWWSPDSSTIALMQFDDGPVNDFTVVNNTTKKQGVERTPYPRAGELNPYVRVGTVSVAGGAVRWVELDNYLQGTYLITGVGWVPDSERIYFFVQDRAQTWLDFSTATKRATEPKCLFRETTEAWVDVPEEPKFLADGSFLLFSERTGWKHIPSGS